MNLRDVPLVALYEHLAHCAEMTETAHSADLRREYRVQLIEAQAELYRRREM